MPKIFIAGHQGMVGSAICRALKTDGETELLTRSRAELDLLDQNQVMAFFEKEQPDQVYLAAAKVGGIHANNIYPAEFIYQNLLIEANVIHSAWLSGVKKLLFLGSSCIYPKLAKQPMAEESLLRGQLEETNEPYAVAKIAGIKLCESYNRQYGVEYRSVMPTNLYGTGDNYHPENSHVIPALIRRFHEAKDNNSKSVLIWGTGSPRREFLYVDDLATACLLVMNVASDKFAQLTTPVQSHINVGSGVDLRISELAELIKLTVGYKGDIEYDLEKPDGTPRKLLNIDRLSSLGWAPKVRLAEGLAMAYKDFLNQHNSQAPNSRLAGNN